MSQTIVCVHCKTPIYKCKAIGRDWAGAAIKAKDFVPVKKEYKQPVDGEVSVCPVCGKGYAIAAKDWGVEDSQSMVVFLLDNGSWWPHPPVGTRKNT